MEAEITRVLSAVPHGVILDATVGGGGHADALLQRCSWAHLVGLDQDLAAIAAASRRLETYGERVTLCHARFDSLGRVLDDLGHRQISACLLDLGVSSPQLDVAERGFSYRHEGPLDMRMDTTRGATAADIVNGASARELADILWHNADERHSRRIARSIIRHRPLTTTTQLASAVAAAVPRATRRAGHPAKRTFQALRIEVNSELGVLPVALQEALDRLAPGGRCAVLSYHSGEDRIVKRAFNKAAGLAPPPRPGLPPPPGATASVRLLWRRPLTPSADEIARNPRARAARLRAVERLVESS